MHYDPRLKNDKSVYDFDFDQPCVWVVYYAGCAGDLWTSILGYHYPKSATEFLGINKRGQVVIDAVDSKWVKQQLETFDGEFTIDHRIIDHVNRGYRARHFPYSMSGQCILSCHLWPDRFVEEIIAKFPQAKIIRILPSNEYENKIATWLGKYKNFDFVEPFGPTKPLEPVVINYQHPRLLDLRFGELWSKTKFEQSYDRVVTHLNLPYKLVKHDFVEFWRSCQHPVIQPQLAQLFDDVG